MSSKSKEFWDSVCVPGSDPPEDSDEYKGMTVLVDADILARRSADATDGRQYTIDNKNFKYMSDVKKYCKKHDLDHKDVVKTYHPEPEIVATKTIDTSVAKLRHQFSGAKFEFYLSPSTNFRNRIAEDYKANRIGKRRPKNLDACKKHFVSRYKAKMNPDWEADDYIGIRMTQLGDKGIAASIDKDFDTFPGWHYNWNHDRLYFMEPLEADRFFYEQCLMGDSTDNIEGLKGIGPKTAKKMLKDCESAREMYEGVLNVWLRKHFPGLFTIRPEDIAPEEGIKRTQEVKERFHRSAKLLYILQEPDKLWEVPRL